MTDIAPWAAVAVALASAAWLGLLAVVFFRRSSEPGALRPVERAFVGATIALALAWTLLAPPWSVGRPKESIDRRERRSCAMIRDGMTQQSVRLQMRRTPRIVSEEDVRGPKAEAWIYEDARCIVHFADGKVVAITQE